MTKREDDVSGGFDEVEAHGRLDEVAVDLLRPVPVEVGHRLEALEATSGAATLESASRSLLVFNVDDVLDELKVAPAFLGGVGDQVVELGGCDQQA